MLKFDLNFSIHYKTFWLVLRLFGFKIYIQKINVQLFKIVPNCPQFERISNFQQFHFNLIVFMPLIHSTGLSIFFPFSPFVQINKTKEKGIERKFEFYYTWERFTDFDNRQPDDFQKFLFLIKLIKMILKNFNLFLLLKPFGWDESQVFLTVVFCKVIKVAILDRWKLAWVPFEPFDHLKHP